MTYRLEVFLSIIVINWMSMKRSMPVYIREPDPDSKSVADRLHWAILRGKIVTVNKLLDSGVPVELPNRAGQTPLFCASFQGHFDIVKLLLKLGADPNRRCSILCCTPVHAACWSGNNHLLTSLLIAGGDLRLHDQKNRSPRDWATMQPNSDSRLATLSLIESFRQMAMKNNELNVDSGVSELNNSTAPRAHRATLKFPAKLRNTLAAMGLVCSENCEFIGPLGNVQGTGFGKILYGRGESAAALWPVPLISETEISDPDDDGCGAEADLNGLLPRGIAYRCGPTTEMVSRRWHQTPVTIRRMRDNQPPDLLFEELQSMSRLRHPGLMLLLGVSATQHWESVQLIYEPIYHGSLHHRLHIMGSAIPLLKKLLILEQICDALLFLHSKELLHCSVSSHAVHLVSRGRAKLGCLETLIEDNNSSKRVYRKVPSSHWEWMAPWLAPECARGESVCTLSDVYSFCCLVWETCSEKLPWSHLDCQEINRMWQKESCNNSRMLPLGPAIPLHVGSFLNLGLQPELSERREIDLQEIYMMLRLQSAVSHSQQKEVYQKSNSPPIARMTSSTPVPPIYNQTQIQPQHGWDAVKESFKKRRTPPPPPPPLPPPPPGQQQVPEVLNCTPDDGDTESNQTVPNENTQCDVQTECNQTRQQLTVYTTPSPNDGERFNYVPMPHQRETRNIQSSEFAIKPASHTTERHSMNCLMAHSDRSTSTYHTPPCQRNESFKNCNAYSGFNSEMRATVAQPAKIYREAAEFETWRAKIDEANEEENAEEESTVEVTGHPSSTSTPRHQHGVTFLACSSGLEDPEKGVGPDDNGGAKPKRSLKFLPNGSQPCSSRIPSFYTITKPRKEFVASLTAIFNDKAATNRTHSILKRRSTSTPEELLLEPNIGDTFNEGIDCISRGVQCNECE
ncbi:inactive serine/threonine-protein kinase TEX14-like isoform X1 [Daphnia magna]|uniref:inactive serine/threonine-protein kinase TEX14-like isoform X1 n=2 Tax=Daphnia magna TaxID=35525 RepID=UPI001E1BA57C|nr:inactive serine/threonine-protein kinase TEX14-like isoform X1 [Daphnia magna]XP_045035425.1 inactive serine/threonine-protein kinase TEX14-like isoform X1 [Daphnia magna]